MSLNLNKNFFNNSNEEENLIPAFRIFTNWNQINIDSKNSAKAIDIEEFRNSNIFNPKDSDLKALFPSIIEKEQPLNQISQLNNSRNQQIKNINNNNDSFLTQNKSLLKNKNPKKKNNRVRPKKNNNNKKRNKSRVSRNTSGMSSFMDISSKRSKSSKASTKRTQLLKAHDSPEKYDEDYDSIDTSSSEENKIYNSNNIFHQNKNIGVYYNNNLERVKKYNRIISQKLKVQKSEEKKSTIEQQLEGFDLMAVDFKALFRDKNYIQKFYKDITAEIKIVYFDRNIRPLHAVFVFVDVNGKVLGREKQMFAGAYYKDEFILFCERTLRKNSQVKVELVVDFADMNNPNYMGWMEINKNLFIDFYFLIKIFE